MKLSTFHGVIGAALLSSTIAAAQAADNGFYIGGGLGMSYGSNFNDHLKDNFPNTSDVDDKAFAWKLLGGYQFNPMFGLEAFYVDFGKFKGKFSEKQGNASIKGKAEQKLSGFGLAATAAWPINEAFSLFGKAGLIYSKGDISGSYSGTDKNGQSVKDSYSKDKNDTNFMAGAGVHWAIPDVPELGLRLEWEFYNDIGKNDDIKGKKVDGTNVHLFSASLTYSF